MSNHFPSETLLDKQMYLLGTIISKTRSVTLNYTQTSLTIVSQMQMLPRPVFTDGNKKGNALITTEA